MEVVIGIGIGLIVGVASSFIFTQICMRRKSVGTLRVDQSTDEPYLFLEIRDSSVIPRIMRSKTVIFRVRIENYLTQK